MKTRTIAALCAALLASGCPSRDPSPPVPGSPSVSAPAPAPKPAGDGIDHTMDKAGDAAKKVNDSIPDPISGVK